MAQDSGVADALLQHAAAGGEPAAQAEVGWRAALGLQPDKAHLFQFGQPDVPKCVPRPQPLTEDPRTSPGNPTQHLGLRRITGLRFARPKTGLSNKWTAWPD